METFLREIREIETEFGREAALAYIAPIVMIPEAAEEIRQAAWDEVSTAASV